MHGSLFLCALLWCSHLQSAIARSPARRQNVPVCNMDISAISNELYNSMGNYFGETDLDCDDATKLGMHDALTGHINATYTDPCTRDALLYGASE